MKLKNLNLRANRAAVGIEKPLYFWEIGRDVSETWLVSVDSEPRLTND